MASLVERLRALYVWPQSVADHYADTLTPRQIKQLYEVGFAADEAADRITALEAMCETLAGALELAGNRLHRCCVDYETGTQQFIEVGEWAAETRQALTQYRAMKEKSDD